MVIGEDDVLLREGISRLLAEAGFDVAAQAGDADSLLRKARGARVVRSGVPLSARLAPGDLRPEHGDLDHHGAEEG